MHICTSTRSEERREAACVPAPAVPTLHLPDVNLCDGRKKGQEPAPRGQRQGPAPRGRRRGAGAEGPARGVLGLAEQQLTPTRGLMLPLHVFGSAAARHVAL